MSRLASPLTAWLACSLAIAGLAGNAALAGFTAYRLPVSELPMIVAFLTFAVVGAVIATGVPRNAVGWLMLAVGAGGGIFGSATAVVELSVADPGTVPAPGVLGWFAANLFLVVLVALLVLLSRIPDGNRLSRRWRALDRLAVVALSLSLLASLAPGSFPEYPELDNPFGVPGFATVAAVLGWVAVGPYACLFLGSLASVALRLRRAQGIVRLQLKWIALAIGANTVTWIGAFLVGFLTDARGAWQLWGVAFCSVPVAIGLAVKRFRLYEIDRIVSRTVSYGVLSLVLGGAYAGLVLGGQAVFASFAGGSDLAVALSTLVVAALFLPVRSRVQGVVDRRFNRRRYDAVRTLEAFGSKLRREVDSTLLTADIETVIARALQPSQAGVWLRKRES